MFNFNLEPSGYYEREKLKEKISISSGSSLADKTSKSRSHRLTRKPSKISVKSIDPLQKKPVFQTQTQEPTVEIPPTEIVDNKPYDDEQMSTEPSKIKYLCPHCELGELVLYYEHEGDCRHDFYFYDCCNPCMILCPSLCGGDPKYRICTLCKTEFDWREVS